MTTKRKTSKKKVVKPTKVAPEYEENYFVSAENPTELRRQILESTKKAVMSMQSFERLQLIREKKLQELSNLRQSVKEIIYLNKKFNEKLPKFDTTLLQDFKNKEEETKKVVESIDKYVKKEVKPDKIFEKDKTDMEKLEDSLAAIEKKLQSLQK